MTAEALSQKYIINTEKTLKQIRWNTKPLTITPQTIKQIKEYINNYLNDAKYYYGQKQFETSLTSIAYCEGLLDALQFIGATNNVRTSRNETRKTIRK